MTPHNPEHPPTAEGIRKRERVLVFVDEFVTEQGYPPTIDEIAADLGVIHKTAAKHVGLLVEQGLLSRGPGPRTLRITPEGRARVNND